MSRPHNELQPGDITVIIDSREQRPPPIDLHLKTVRQALTTGDYSILGLSHLVRIERKSSQDLAMSCGRERERFDRCIERLRGFELSMIVIEASEANIELKQYRGEIHPNAILGSVHDWRAMGINIDWAGNAQTAALHISRTLFAFARRRYRDLLAFHDALPLAPAAKEEKVG